MVLFMSCHRKGTCWLLKTIDVNVVMSTAHRGPQTNIQIQTIITIYIAFNIEQRKCLEDWNVEALGAETWGVCGLNLWVSPAVAFTNLFVSRLCPIQATHCGIHVSFNSTPTLGLSMFVISRAFLRAAKFAFVLVTLVGTPFALNLCRYKVDTNTTRCLDTVKSIGINVHQMEKHVEFKVKNGKHFFLSRQLQLS
jgi:hypothetical protein